MSNPPTSNLIIIGKKLPADFASPFPAFEYIWVQPTLPKSYRDSLFNSLFNANFNVTIYRSDSVLQGVYYLSNQKTHDIDTVEINGVQIDSIPALDFQGTKLLSYTCSSQNKSDTNKIILEIWPDWSELKYNYGYLGLDSYSFWGFDARRNK